jgi:RNA polymerase primary sigma factor
MTKTFTTTPGQSTDETCPVKTPSGQAETVEPSSFGSPPRLQTSEFDGQIPGNHIDCEAFAIYIREICKTALLTMAEESELAKRIRAGDSTAREQMIKANLRLVVKIARDFDHCGLPLLDLVSEGNIGLMKAVERFDSTKGAKMSTYAAFWIKQSIRRALANQARTIRLPVHVLDKLMLIRRAQTESWSEHGRESTDQELSGKLHISARRIEEYREASVAPSSLDALINESAAHTFSEIVPDENGTSPYQQLEAKTEANIVQQLIGGLNARERRILEARFGLTDSEPQTLDVIGKAFGLTRERIRQIQEVALTKLRRGINSLNLEQPGTF